MIQARLFPARVNSILAALNKIKLGLRLLGLIAAEPNVIPIGLLYMRLLQWWLKTKGFSMRGNQFHMIKVMHIPLFLGHVDHVSCPKFIWREFGQMEVDLF